MKGYPKAWGYLRPSFAPKLSQRICFIHVPKCGGSSLRGAIARCYPLRYRIRSRGIQHIEAATSKNAAQVLGIDVHAYRLGLLRNLLSEPENVFVSGHVAFSKATFEEYGDRWRFVTILREPVARWYSSYFFNRYKQSEHYRLEAELEEFVESPRALASASMYIRYFSSESVMDGVRSFDAVRRAKENLSHFSVAGVLEDQMSFVGAFSSRFGVRLKLPRVNTNPAPASVRSSVPAHIHRRVLELCAPDRAIYEYLCSR